MPYITNDRRSAIDTWDNNFRHPVTWQELSYQLDYCIREWFTTNGHTVSSKTIGEVWAAIEGARKAFNDEVAEVYEAKKRNENGTIFHDLRAGI